MEGASGQLSDARHLQSRGVASHPGEAEYNEERFTSGGARQDSASGQMPDAMAHLLSAAEAASSARK